MLLTSVAAFAVLMATDPRPPRPSDDQLVAAFATARPDAHILQHTGRDIPEGDGRAVCGVASIDGQAEPFVVYAVWAASPALSVDAAGQTRMVMGAPVWRTDAIAPGIMDREGRRHAGVTRVVGDALARKQVLAVCTGLTPPEGVTWRTEV